MEGSWGPPKGHGPHFGERMCGRSEDQQCKSHDPSSQAHVPTEETSGDDDDLALLTLEVPAVGGGGGGGRLQTSTEPREQVG